MHEKYESKGLSVLGITGQKEDRVKTEAWVASKGVEYTYGYFKDDLISKATDQKGYPHAALVNPKGEIVWTGHPSSLTGGIIEDALKGASKYLSFGWSKEFEKVAKGIHTLDYGAAMAAAKKIQAGGNDEAAEVIAAVEGMLNASITSMTDALSKGDFLAALDMADGFKGKLKGLAQEADVKKVYETIKADPTSKTVLKGQKALQKLVTGELRKKKQIKSAMEKAQKLAEKYEGTIVATQADEFVAGLRLRMRG